MKMETAEVNMSNEMNKTMAVSEDRIDDPLLIAARACVTAAAIAMNQILPSKGKRNFQKKRKSAADSKNEPIDTQQRVTSRFLRAKQRPLHFSH